MAILFFEQNRTTGAEIIPNLGLAFAFDVTNEVSESKRITITKHPISRGRTGNDHTRVEPIKVTLNGIISATPVPISERRPPAGARVSTPWS